MASFKKKHNNYDFIARMFVATSSLKEEITKPFLKGEHIYATNSFFAVRIDKKLVGLEYLESDKNPDAKKIFDQIEKGNETRYDLNNLLGMLTSYDIKTEMVGLERECKDCNGSGSGECCECGHDIDCEKCEGSGGELNIKSRTAVTFANKENRFGSITFGESNLNVQYLGTAALALKVVGADYCYVREEKERLILTDNKGVKIIIMLMTKK